MNFITLFFLGLLVLSGILFLFYKKVIFVSMNLITVMFAISAIGLLSALFIPGIYESFSRNAFNENFFGVQLQNADSALNAIANVPGGIINSIENIFNPDNSTNDYEFNSELYSSFIGLITGMIRIFVLIIASIGLVMSTYLRYTFTGIREAARLEKRVKELEHKLDTTST